MAIQNEAVKFRHKHLLGIQSLSIPEVNYILDESMQFVDFNKREQKKLNILAGKTQINLFFESSTRTLSSFELAGKRLGADVMNMNVSNSSIKKGETLIDTAMTLNAMHPDVLIIRHQDSGAANLLAQKVNCSVINAGDDWREHPTQALLDALTIKIKKGKIEGLRISSWLFKRLPVGATCLTATSLRSSIPRRSKWPSVNRPLWVISRTRTTLAKSLKWATR